MLAEELHREAHALLDMVAANRGGPGAGIDHQLVIGRNEPGVQNMHRQIEALLRKEVTPA